LAPHDAQLIIELTNEIRGYRQDLKVLTTKLLGDPDNENEHGRLPMIEAKVEAQGKLITHVIKREWMWKGATVLISAAFALCTAIYEINHVIKGH
jgi:hypothetical protein